VPVRIPGVPVFSTIASGDNHSCALTASGALWCWGGNNHGEMARGDTVLTHHPVPVAPGVTFRSMSLGFHSTCAVSAEEKLFCWGLDAGGALGYLATQPCTDPSGTPAWCTITLRRSDPNVRYTRAALGFTHGCGVTPGGETRCWGSNTAGELGTGGRDSAGATPVQADVRFTSLAAGSAFTCGVTTSGDAYCWGTNSEGQTGSGAGADAPLPGFISSPAKFVLVTAGKEHACGLTTEHEAFCWGSNAQGQLGAVAKQRSFVPVAVVFPP
jgi:hypothetical protein